MKVLLAYDGFERSRGALDEALRLAREEGASVTILSIVPPDARGARSGGHVGVKPHADQDVAVAHAYFRENGVETEMKVGHGRPADEIREAARSGGFDLLVLGTRGLGPVGRVLLGSVSQAVVKEAPCSVAVVGEKGIERFGRAVVEA